MPGFARRSRRRQVGGLPPSDLELRCHIRSLRRAGQAFLLLRDSGLQLAQEEKRPLERDPDTEITGLISFSAVAALARQGESSTCGAFSDLFDLNLDTVVVLICNNHGRQLTWLPIATSAGQAEAARRISC